jgi:hypothetical protein
MLRLLIQPGEAEHCGCLAARQLQVARGAGWTLLVAVASAHWSADAIELMQAAVRWGVRTLVAGWLSAGFRLPRRMRNSSKPRIAILAPTTILELACRSFEGLHAQKLWAKYVCIVQCMLRCCTACASARSEPRQKRQHLVRSTQACCSHSISKNNCASRLRETASLHSPYLLRT